MTRRFDAGHRAYVALLNGRPAAWGWVATRSADIGELGATFAIPAGERYLWNFVTLASHRTSKLPFVIQFFTPELHWIVREVERKAWCASAATDWQWRDCDFAGLDMSAMTGAYAEIVDRGASSLPTFEESAKDHLNLLAVYNRHWFGAEDGGAACPIT
jgi:hypothetical protein